MESEWNYSELPLCKGVKNQEKRTLSGPFFWKSGWGREWHSRGQRFDPAYLHQKGPEIVSELPHLVRKVQKSPLSGNIKFLVGEASRQMRVPRFYMNALLVV